MDIIVAHFEASKAKHAKNQNLLARITTAWHAFDKFYNLSDETPLYTCALLLQPADRKAYLEEH